MALAAAFHAQKPDCFASPTGSYGWGLEGGTTTFGIHESSSVFRPDCEAGIERCCKAHYPRVYLDAVPARWRSCLSVPDNHELVVEEEATEQPRKRKGSRSLFCES